jgi:hypothetical protein
MSLVLLAILAAVIGELMQANAPPDRRTASQIAADQASKAEEGMKWSAYFAGVELCKQHLKAPATADFSDYLSDKHTGVNKVGTNFWHAFGRVDAQNSFGAKLREDWEVYLRGEGSNFVSVYFRLGESAVGERPLLDVTNGAE